MKKQKKLNMAKVKMCVFIAVVLLIIVIVCVIINGNDNKYKTLTVLLNNEFIETMNPVTMDEEENIYFSKSDIALLFDENIYYNEAEEELITTFNKHVALLKLDQEYGLIDDENTKLKGTLKEENDEIYIPITDLQIVYDLEIVYSKKSNRIIMESTTEEKKVAMVERRTELKSKKGLFSEKLEKLIIGDKVVILEEDGNYKKVRTPLGNIGYIKTKKISEEIIVREAVKTDKKDIKLHRNYSNISGVYDNLEDVDKNKLNVVVPTFFYIDENSKVLNKTGSKTAAYSIYKKWMEENGLIFMPTVNSNVLVSESLLSYTQRSQVINSLVSLVKDNGYMGINIEFDAIDDVNSFNGFIIELMPKCKNADIKVCVSIRNDKNLDKKKLEKIVDYVVEE